MTREELYEKARLLPLTPGVYIMHSKSGKVIYVGKSKALRNRVSSYFAPYADHHGKTRRMVDSVDDFEVYFTATELEALLQKRPPREKTRDKAREKERQKRKKQRETRYKGGRTI